jgi:DNA-binding NarL/FixJ family response regulator
MNILLADDHPLVLRGLRTALEAIEGWTVCGEARTGREAVALARQLAPEVAIIDVAMPDWNGIEATRRIRRLPKPPEVLILTMHAAEEVADEALAAGARGFLLKSDAGDEVVTAVRAVAERRPYFTSFVARMVRRGFLGRRRGPASGPSPRPLSPRLTAREREILELVGRGETNKTIAARLGISVETARTHRSNVLRKLDLHTSGDVIRYAIRNRIIQA